VFAEGKEYPGGVAPLRRFEFVSPGFLHTTGTRMIAGREFTWSDIYGLRPMVMVSENLAREIWGAPSAAIGKRLRWTPISPWQEVAGVIQDVRQNGIQERAPEIVYWPIMMSFGPNTLLVRRAVTFVIRSERTGTESFLTQVRQAVWSVNASLPLASVRTVRDIYDESLATTSFTLVMLGIAGAMALMLGLIGVYGVISYAVSQRQREIGIRLVLGAQKRELRRMFVRQALALLAAGVGLGLVASLGLAHLMKSLLFGVSPFDPLTYIAVPIVLAAATALASYLPARRATAINPVEALKAE
jgi:FtsX-like permease family